MAFNKCLEKIEFNLRPRSLGDYRQITLVKKKLPKSMTNYKLKRIFLINKMFLTNLKIIGKLYKL
jgi:hypothetical protein